MAYKYICRKCGVGSMRETNDVSIMCDGNCGYLISPSRAVKVEPVFEAPAVDLEVEHYDAAHALRRYCLKNKVAWSGQHIEENGYLFIDGFSIGFRASEKRARLFSRLSSEASRQQSERIKNLEDDLTFKLSEAHVITMGKLERLRQVALEVVEGYLADVVVHPCDEQNRDVKISVLPPGLRRLAEELKSVEAPEFYARNHPLHRAVFMALDSYMSGDTFEDGVRALAEQSKMQAQQIKALDQCLETVNAQRDHWMAIAKGEQ